MREACAAWSPHGYMASETTAAACASEQVLAGHAARRRGAGGVRITGDLYFGGGSMVEAQTCKLLLLAATGRYEQASSHLRALEALAAGEGQASAS